MPSFGFIPCMKKKIFKHFYENRPFLSPRQPIKFTDLDKSHIKRRGLLNKHFCKKIQNIPNETEKIVNFLFSHYKSMGTISCHSNQSSYPIGINQRTSGPVNAHLISWPSKAQSIQNLENIWLRNDLDLQYSHTFINSISCLHLPTFRSQAAIVSEKNPLFSLFPIEKPKLPNLTLP